MIEYNTCVICGGEGIFGSEKCLACDGKGRIANGASFSGGVKDDAGKPRMDLIDGYALEELAKVLTFGAEKKYTPHNWREGIALSRLLASSARHLSAIMRGEDVDEETGLAHAAHLMCCAMFLTWTMKNLPAMDDRWKKPASTTKEFEKGVFCGKKD